MDVEWHRMANLLQMRGPDGLLYIPTVGRPWAKDFGGAADMLKTELGDQMMAISMSARMIESAAVYYTLTGDRQWKELVQRKVRALRRLATDRGDYAYYDRAIYAPGEERVEGPVSPPNITCSSAWLAQGLITAYRLTGDEAVIDRPIVIHA